MGGKKAFCFDRDGTLYWGNPKGPIKKCHLISLKKIGYDTGAAGGQLAEEQYKDWKQEGITPDFVFFKGDIYNLKNRYEKVIHVGNDITDKEVASRAKFGFMEPEQFLIWLRQKLSKYGKVFKWS